MVRHESLTVVDGQLALKRQLDLDRLARQVSRDTVSATTDVDVGVPSSPAGSHRRRCHSGSSTAGGASAPRGQTVRSRSPARCRGIAGPPPLAPLLGELIEVKGHPNFPSYGHRKFLTPVKLLLLLRLAQL